MRKVGKTIMPRLPKEAREKLKSGGAHKNKKKLGRREKHQGKDNVAG